MPTIREAITSMYARGLPQPEIARALELAPTTVSYHLDRIVQSVSPAEEKPPEPAVLRARTRERVASLIDQGMAYVEIARTLGISKATVSYHAGRLGRPREEKYGLRYDWDAVQRYYEQGHSVRDCMRAFGFSSTGWSGAVRRGAVSPRPSSTPISELLVAGTYRGRDNLKLRLIKEGLKQGNCERCGLSEWLGQHLSMALHHINGDRLDNRLENLELLCPNCHSQTDTYSGRNGHRRRTDQTPLIVLPGGQSTHTVARSVEGSAS